MNHDGAYSFMRFCGNIRALIICEIKIVVICLYINMLYRFFLHVFCMNEHPNLYVGAQNDCSPRANLDTPLVGEKRFLGV